MEDIGTAVRVTWSSNNTLVRRIGWLQKSSPETGEIRLLTQYSEPDNETEVIHIPVDSITHIAVI